MLVKLFQGKKFLAKTDRFDSFNQAKYYCFDVLFLENRLGFGTYTIVGESGEVFVFELRSDGDWKDWYTVKE